MSRTMLVLLPVTLAALVLAVLWLTRRPAHDRPWVMDQSVLPTVTFAGDVATVHGVRNFRWAGADSATPAWEDRSYDLTRLQSAWYILVPFSSVWRGPAHGFVSFGFDDGQYLAVSIEARRERGEIYGVLKGMLRQFELIYVLADEHDVIGRRAVYDGTDVFLYPLRATPEAMRGVLRAMLERASSLATHAEFYNTLTNSCTLNLVHHVNDLIPGRIPVGWRVVVPGYSDSAAYTAGLINTTLPLDQARARHRINDRARESLDRSDFSARIREFPQ